MNGKSLASKHELTYRTYLEGIGQEEHQLTVWNREELLMGPSYRWMGVNSKEAAADCHGRADRHRGVGGGTGGGDTGDCTRARLTPSSILSQGTQASSGTAQYQLDGHEPSHSALRRMGMNRIQLSRPGPGEDSSLSVPEQHCGTGPPTPEVPLATNARL